MLVYIGYFLFLLLGALVLGGQKAKEYLMLAMFFLCLIIGFRSLEVGVDTSGYVDDFFQLSILNSEELSNKMQENKEPLYILCSWLIGNFSTSSTVYTFFWAMFPCFALYIFLKDEITWARGIFISILCLFALGLFAFFVAGIRQTAAISIVILAYSYLVRNEIEYNLSFLCSYRFVIFCLLMYLAYNFHNSSVLFLIVLPLLKMKISWWYYPFVISLFFVGRFFSIEHLVKMSSLFFEDRFATYGTVYESSQSISAFLMQLILFTICFLQRDNLIYKDPRNGYLFNIMLVGLVFQSFSGMIYEMARIAFYFSIFAIILVPKAIEEYSPKIRDLLYIGMGVLLLVYLFLLSGSNLPKYSSALF